MVASDGSELPGNQDKKLCKPSLTIEDGSDMLSDNLIRRVLRYTLRWTCGTRSRNEVENNSQ